MLQYFINFLYDCVINWHLVIIICFYCSIMSYSRRQIMRLLRLRNLLLMTIVVMLLYFLKKLSGIDSSDKALEILQAPQKILFKDNTDHFVPTNLNVSIDNICIFDLWIPTNQIIDYFVVSSTAVLACALIDCSYLYKFV